MLRFCQIYRELVKIKDMDSVHSDLKYVFGVIF
jgi:hypothetical protein